MDSGRRNFLVTSGAATVFGVVRSIVHAAQETSTMYGLIGKMEVVPGRRDELIAILLDGTGGMPGCLSYVIAKDPADENGIWITEVWDSEASHAASLTLSSVKAAIAKGRPLISGFGQRVVTTPIGGHGLTGRQR